MSRTVIRGIPACHGVAVGPAVVLSRPGDVPRRRIDVDDLDDELDRFRRAVELSRREVESVRSSLVSESDADRRLILDAHLLLHRDELLVEATQHTIAQERVNAEWALLKIVDALRLQLAQSASAIFRERGQDVSHVAQHILRWLTGGHERPHELAEGAVLVAEDLSPADAARLADRPVLALVTDMGSATSHTALFARSLGIPCVLGAAGVRTRIADGDVVIVDALRGEVILDADEPERVTAIERGQRYERFTASLREKQHRPPATRDGVRVELLANVELPGEAALAIEAGTEGVGLYRTEFLYLNRDDVPDEELQAEVYCDVVRAMAPRPVTFRTYDLGADKLPEREREPGGRGQNPALGLRGLRLSLARPDLFDAQVRAILRASACGPVCLMFPMVATLGELRQARGRVLELRDELLAKGLAIGSVPVGIMVEVPAAALMSDTLVQEADFVSVGTNDLVQYTLALDRGNPKVAHLARPLDPAVLRLLSMTVRSAEKQGIPASICGDMASDPFALPIAVGLGYRRLSVPCSTIPLVRELLLRIDMTEAREASRAALECGSAAEVYDVVRERFQSALGDVWLEEGLG